MSMPPEIWTILLVVIGAAIAMVAFILPGAESSRTEVFRIAEAIIYGAIGAHGIKKMTDKPPSDPPPPNS